MDYYLYDHVSNSFGGIRPHRFYVVLAELNIGSDFSPGSYMIREWLSSTPRVDHWLSSKNSLIPISWDSDRLFRINFSFYPNGKNLVGHINKILKVKSSSAKKKKRI